MLKIRRKRYEQVQIGPDVTMTVVGWNHETVFLRFEGPKDPKILRKELFDRIALDKRRQALQLNELQRAMDKLSSDMHEPGAAFDAAAPSTSKD